MSTTRLHKIMHDLTVSNLVATHQNRRLLLQIPGEGGGLDGGGTTQLSTPHPIFQPLNISSETPSRRNVKQQQSTSSFDSSMALTIVVLLTALFFMGFFSLYLRRFADDDSSNSRRRRRTSLQRGKGLDPSTVRSLPLLSYGEDAKQVIFSDCPICLSEFEPKEIVKIIPSCRHVFHPLCIDTWLASHVSCPLCRSTTFFKKGDSDVCLAVKLEPGNNGGAEVGSRLTAVRDDTWREAGLRRLRSWTSLGDRVVLQRSMSF